MSRSKDQSRPFQAGRHRAEAAPVSTKPLTPPSPDAEVPNAEPAPTEPASAALRRSRIRRPAFEVPPAPETAPVAKAPPVPEPKSSAPETAPTTAPMVTQQSRARGDAAEEPLGTTPAATPGDEPVTALSPQVAAFSSQPQAVLRKAASVRVMGHRMAVVAGAFAVLLGVGAATQAAELPFFGKESSAQDAAGAPDATRPTSGTRPTSATSPASPQAAASTTPPSTSSGTPAQASPGTDGVPAAANPRATTLPTVASLPMPVDVPTLAGIVAATSAAAPPSSNLQPPAVSSTVPASPTETTAPAAAPAPAPIAASPAPSPTTATATAPAPAPAVEVGAAEDTVDTYAYASDRFASYGWGAEQMTALNTLWDTSTKWRPSQVDRGLSYIKQRYGSPAEALEFRAANNWY
jgi:hypothetical protein